MNDPYTMRDLMNSGKLNIEIAPSLLEVLMKEYLITVYRHSKD